MGKKRICVEVGGDGNFGGWVCQVRVYMHV